MTGMKTRLDYAEVLPDGTLQIRLQKIFEDANGVVAPIGFHRAVLTPLADSAAEIESWEDQLVASGGGPMAQADKTVILDLADALHTDARRSAYAAHIAALAANAP